MLRLSHALTLLAGALLLLCGIVGGRAIADNTNSIRVSVAADSTPQVIFDVAHDRCGDWDIPDVNARAFRDSNGHVVMFALYDTNHALRGADLDHLTLDCHSALKSPGDPDPSHYDDRNFLTATWTNDGENIVGLIHHEYHANLHGRCTVNSDLGCWYNTILAYRSQDAGASFIRTQPLVVAAAPFRQDVGQGRHRGFFNPSNIFSDGTYEYFFAATTGWDGQPYGACLFRSITPYQSASWHAYDGHHFRIRYDDPYESHFAAPKACMPIKPFIFPVGAVVRVRDSGEWLAVFQASHDAGATPVDGFYYATAEDLEHWSEPRLLIAGKTLYSNLCTAGGSVIGYPSILDPTAKGRNFDNVGASPYLYYAIIKTANCATGERLLVRRKLTIVRGPSP